MRQSWEQSHAHRLCDTSCDQPSFHSFVFFDPQELSWSPRHMALEIRGAGSNSSLILFVNNFMQTIVPLPIFLHSLEGKYIHPLSFSFVYNSMLIINHIWLDHNWPKHFWWHINMHWSEIPPFLLQQCNISVARKVDSYQPWIMLPRWWNFCQNHCIWSILGVLPRNVWTGTQIMTQRWYHLLEDIHKFWLDKLS